jgi:JAB domain-containing protein similar to deubiquitination enzymes
MKRIDSSLITPIYVKQDQNMPLPKDPVYYLLARDNLFLCRNHPHFQSCVPAPQWPTELATHAASFVSRYPPIPREQLERICGFFGHMSDKQSAEAIALLAWDQITREVHTIVPPQVSAVSRGSWGASYPIGVKYRLPQDLPNHWSIFCDIHSHCEMGAYASQTDIEDENNITGLHIVIGRLHQEPPEFHVEGVVDGTRLPFEWNEVVTGYQHRDTFPLEWVNQVAVTNYATFHNFDFDAGEPKRATGTALQTDETNHPGRG